MQLATPIPEVNRVLARRRANLGRKCDVENAETGRREEGPRNSHHTPQTTTRGNTRDASQSQQKRKRALFSKPTTTKPARASRKPKAICM